MEPKQTKRAWLRQVLESAKAPLGNREIAARPDAAEAFKLPAGSSKLSNTISIELAGLTKSKANPIKRIKTPEGFFKYYDSNLAFDFASVGTPDAGLPPKATKAPKNGRKETVRWTNEERENVTRALAEVLVRDHDRIAGHEYRLMGLAIKEAQQKALPETRQRLEAPPSSLAPIVKRARRLANDKLHTLATAPAPVAALPAPPPAEVSAPPAPVAMGPAAGLSQIIEGLVNAAVNVITERVTHNVTDQITYAMSTALMRIESRLPGAHGDNGHAKPEAEHHEEANLQKRKVFILGPLPAQQGMLRHEFESCFDLRFAEKREPVSRLKALAAGSHHVIAWLDFLPHKMTDLVKHANPQAYEQFRGGMTALRERLTQIYVNGQTH